MPDLIATLLSSAGMIVGVTPEEPTLTEEQVAARRSNRRTLLVVLAFIVAIGVIPLAAVLISKLG